MTWGQRKLKPETAEEVKEVETVEGMRKRIMDYARDDSMTNYVLQHAHHRGLSGDDTMTILAYQALLERESFREMVLEFHDVSITKSIYITGKP